jgi:hypothetical protein
MPGWLTPLGANDDLEYEATYSERLEEATEWIEYVRKVKGYKPYQHYFRPQPAQSKKESLNGNP